MGDRVFTFGPFFFDANRRTLLKRGAPLKIGQRGLSLLEALLAADGRAVSKAELMDAAWQTENIEESNLTVQIAALRKSLGRAKNGEEWIITIQRSGYQFVRHNEGVKHTDLMEDGPTALMAEPSIAVLPFENMSSDPEQDFFADGLAEDLITDLSRVRGLLVIARHSSFSYRDQKLSLGQIARELGIRYIVEGSVRRSTQRIRITAQLIDTESNMQIWAERFDRNLVQVFDIQDEVVGHIIKALANVLPLAKPLVKRRQPNLEAYELFVQGRILSMQSPNDNQTARPLLARACELDPGFAEAQAWLAMNLLFGWMYCYEENSRARVLELAPRAVELDPNNADAQVILGYIMIFDGGGNLAAGRARFEQALKLNPNHADAWLFLADLEVLEGHAQVAVETCKRAFQLNPHPPPYYYWLYSWMLYAARRYDEIVDLFLSTPPQSIGSQRNLAAAFAQLGRIDEARVITSQFMEAVPQFTINSWISVLPFHDEGDRQHFIDGYLLAGFPLQN